MDSIDNLIFNAENQLKNYAKSYVAMLETALEIVSVKTNHHMNGCSAECTHYIPRGDSSFHCRSMIYHAKCLIQQLNSYRLQKTNQEFLQTFYGPIQYVFAPEPSDAAVRKILLSQID